MKLTREEILKYIDMAIEVRENAYTPYSMFKVGAVVIGDNGNVVRGANIENASYGLSNCAERSAIFSALSQGVKKIEGIVVVADTTGPVSPCGACRQVIKEFATDDITIVLANLNKDYKVMTMEELLPYGFEL
ncbi:cytidine deaminase [uncultured Cetobacterium sp.]|uniref:cytidine deaminase n=1 Tax=uncultured Cetobacterium sp. TaxID=527638 RepID=UPI00262AC567|nr:cytidine deaminase [uncultured Cetobacterium sp.]